MTFWLLCGSGCALDSIGIPLPFFVIVLVPRGSSVPVSIMPWAGLPSVGWPVPLTPTIFCLLPPLAHTTSVVLTLWWSIAYGFNTVHSRHRLWCRWFCRTFHQPVWLGTWLIHSTGVWHIKWWLFHMLWFTATSTMFVGIVLSFRHNPFDNDFLSFTFSTCHSNTWIKL